MVLPLAIGLAFLLSTCLLLARHCFKRGKELLRLQLRLENETKHLREADERFQSLFSTNPLPMWVQDSETLRFVSVNDAAIHEYGFSREEFLAMNLLDIRPAEDVPALVSALRGYVPGFNSAGVFRRRRKNGSLLFADVQVFRLDNGGHLQDLVVIQSRFQKFPVSHRNLASLLRLVIAHRCLKNDRIEDAPSCEGVLLVPEFSIPLVHLLQC
jgi:PAS domain S-box-containing protein